MGQRLTRTSGESSGRLGAREARDLRDDAVETQAATAKPRKGDKLKADIDDLLDEIDDVLEENAEDFVRAYIQKGGQ